MEPTMSLAEARRIIRGMADRGSLSRSQASSFLVDLDRGANPTATVKLARSYA